MALWAFVVDGLGGCSTITMEFFHVPLIGHYYDDAARCCAAAVALSCDCDCADVGFWILTQLDA